MAPTFGTHISYIYETACFLEVDTYRLKNLPTYYNPDSFYLSFFKYFSRDRSQP